MRCTEGKALFFHSVDAYFREPTIVVPDKGRSIAICYQGRATANRLSLGFVCRPNSGSAFPFSCNLLAYSLERMIDWCWFAAEDFLTTVT